MSVETIRETAKNITDALDEIRPDTVIDENKLHETAEAERALIKEQLAAIKKEE